MEEKIPSLRRAEKVRKIYISVSYTPNAKEAKEAMEREMKPTTS